MDVKTVRVSAFFKNTLDKFSFAVVTSNVQHVFPSSFAKHGLLRMGTGSSAIEKTKNIGNQYFAKQEYHKAVSAYSKALRYDEFNPVLLSNRCFCYLKTGKLKLALEDALACVKAKRDWNKAYYRLASVFWELNCKVEALFYFRIAHNLNSSDETTKNRIQEIESQVQETERGKGNLLEWSESFYRPKVLKNFIETQISEV